MNQSAVIKFCFFFIVLSFSQKDTLFSQSNIEVNNLKGLGQSNVYADENGVLKRTFNDSGDNSIAISPLDFSGWNRPDAIRNSFSIREFFAPIHLPDGVKFDKVTFWYEEEIGPDLVVEVYRRDYDSLVLIMSQHVMGTPGDPTEVTTDIFAGPISVVNNKDYQYFMRIGCFQDGLLVDWPTELVFYQANISFLY